MDNERRSNEAEQLIRRPLISQTSILILSAFLIGMSSGQTFEHTNQIYGFFAGWAGLVAFLGLKYANRRKQAAEIQRAWEDSIDTLTGRFDRHVKRQAQSERSRRRSDLEHQYLTVVRATR